MSKRKKTLREYGEVFDSLMQYAEARIGRTKIKSQQDLAEIFKKLDDHRKDKQERAKVSDKLINILIDHPKAKQYVGMTIGHGRGKKVLSDEYIKTHEEKILRYRAEGRSLYQYDGGIAAKIKIVTRYGRVQYRFRDLDSGKFVKSKELTGDA